MSGDAPDPKHATRRQRLGRPAFDAHRRSIKCRPRRDSNHWISTAMRRQDATLERLRVDRQLEEALTHGPDPLHLAQVLGLDEKTAMRYADSARTLLEQAAEPQHQ
ncbi:hypothetical protein [Streptomyces sp. NPDC002133]|uniref:hypothetical protein n=1 Tax=Streptomyces sp. NPDC002133 TaxID=3154409 RepID=UPI0033327270